MNQFDYEAETVLFRLRANFYRDMGNRKPDNLPELEPEFETYYVLRDIEKQHQLNKRNQRLQKQ